MKQVFGISWDDRKRTHRLGLLLVPVMLLSLLTPAQQQEMGEAASEATRLVSVIVSEMPGAGSVPEQLVADLGGKVTLELGIIDGFAATVPAASLDPLQASPSVRSVSLDRPIQMLATTDEDAKALNGDGSPRDLARTIQARDLWKDGYTGQGIDVAVIDTGISPVEGLNAPGKIKAVADFSFEQGDESLRFFDTYGHGTHMAGLIAGRDEGAVVERNNKEDFLGIAPDAGLVGIKVGNAVGAADVSQVIAAIDWAVTHRNDPGLNIRVLNLSFGTDGVQPYQLDPLAYAAEVAWRHGITVVAAAGNSGVGDNRLNNPASDPFVIAVGATDTMGTEGVGDDVTPEWTERGDGLRNPDVVAPGKSLLSLRVENSHLDFLHPEGRAGSRFFKGSGTSQAAAVVSGAAALLLSHRPELSPDQVKYLLKNTAIALPFGDPVAQGEGLIDVKGAAKAEVPSAAEAAQTFEPSTGLGSLDAARGSAHVVDPDGNVLEGEIDIFGKTWSGTGWSTTGWSGTGWSGTGWSGTSWSGTSWSGTGWSGTGWSGKTWSGTGWSGTGWSGKTWSGTGWS